MTVKVELHWKHTFAGSILPFAFGCCFIFLLFDQGFLQKPKCFREYSYYLKFSMNVFYRSSSSSRS